MKYVSHVQSLGVVVSTDSAEDKSEDLFVMRCVTMKVRLLSGLFISTRPCIHHQF